MMYGMDKVTISQKYRLCGVLKPHLIFNPDFHTCVAFHTRASRLIYTKFLCPTLPLRTII